MKVLVAGGRSFNNPQLLRDILVECVTSGFIDDNSTLITGMAEGVDIQASMLWEKVFELPQIQMPADWGDISVKKCKVKYRKNGDAYNCLAGFNRNAEMAKECDVAIIIWDGCSSGTKDMINRMEMEEIKPLLVLNYYGDVISSMNVENLA